MLTFFAASETIFLACFFVATNKIFRPDIAIFFSASEASSSLLIVLYKLIIWIPFLSIYINGAILGFHFLVRCPK